MTQNDTTGARLSLCTPCDFAKPKPVAQRTHAYLRGLGIGGDPS